KHMFKPNQCQATTAKNTRCKNSAVSVTTRFCRKHKPHDEKIPEMIITYPGGLVVNGGPMTPQQTQSQPSIDLKTPPLYHNKFLTLIMIDPDAPAAKVNG